MCLLVSLFWNDTITTVEEGNFMISSNVLLTGLCNVPGVPSLVSRRKMTLKLNYIYIKVL
jgi:hypothetical protein